IFVALPLTSASKWEKMMEARAKQIRARYGNGSNPGLQKRLLAMRDEDQKVRMTFLNSKEGPERKKWQSTMESMDARLTEELKALVAQHGWPTFDTVGLNGSEAAMLLLIHSPDVAFQASMIPQLTRLVDEGRLLGNDLATLIDRQLTNSGKPQRFGTQFIG